MTQAFLVDALRTPVGKHNGILKAVRPDDMAALVLKRIVERNELDPGLIDEVYMGCANQAGEDNRNVARMAVLLAGLPHSVPAVTINRLCASGMEAAAIAFRAIASGEGHCYIAGGVESMTRAPFSVPKLAGGFDFGNLTAWDTTLGWRYPNPAMKELFPLESMGETAENIYERWKIPRELQDQFAFESHQKAVMAHERGLFEEEIIPVEIPQRKGDPIVVNRDEGPRKDTTLEKLATLRPAFRKGGTVTAGNSSSLNDGAAALLICSEKFIKDHNLKPLARIVASASAGVDPRYMGIGPVDAVEKLLARTGVTKFEIGLWEINEAFAVQALAVLAELDPHIDRVNSKGGAIAIGHPLGMSGARILGTLARSMRDAGTRWGIASLCVGVGQGQAILLENMN
ncbi:MAG: acetyl-CoA C-acyltransferase [Calditrichaeota bacterium]|nr:acetyl-CoA C-acyltransferase [Calditrichota bacterium]MCB9369571.1 acetyl-CoA C-acyltransferase [Calditrichota bacterium]